MIEPGTGAEQLYVRNLAAYRVRAIRAATAGEPYAYLDEAFREAVKRVGRTFESRNDGLVEWAELLAKEVLAGKAVPGVDALVLDADAIAADEAELANLAAGGAPVEEPESDAGSGSPATPEKPAEGKPSAKPKDEKTAEAKDEKKEEKKAEPEKKEEKKAEPEKKEEKKAEPEKTTQTTPTPRTPQGQHSPSGTNRPGESKTETPKDSGSVGKESAQKTSDDWYTMSGEKKAKATTTTGAPTTTTTTQAPTTTTTTAAPTTTTTTGAPAESTSAETKKAT